MAGDLIKALSRYGVAIPLKGRRFHVCCPIHQDDTPSCHVDLDKQLWHCFGCDQGGDAIDLVRIREHVSCPEAKAILGIEDQWVGARVSGRQQTASSGQRDKPSAFAGLPSPTALGPLPAKTVDLLDLDKYAAVARTMAPDTTAGKADDDRKAIEVARWWYRQCAPLKDTPAVRYCETRGISAELAAANNARYCPDFMKGGPAVVFPVTMQEDGKTCVCAIQGRYLFPAPDGSERPDKKTRGKLWGVYSTIGGIQQEAVIVTEAPFDALSLAACGFPALALMGTHFPAWLPAAIGTRPAYLATDNDQAGDGGAQKLCDALAANGGKVFRLKPPGAVKDWNQYLCTYGPAAMEAALTAAVFPDRTPGIPRPMVDPTPSFLTGTVVVLHGDELATVTAYLPPNEDFPAGWCELVTDDGQHGQADCRYLRVQGS